MTFGDAPVKLLASDLGRFEREQWVESVVIGPAERYVVDVLFDRSGSFPIANTIQAVNHFRGEFYPRVDTLSVVTVTDERVPGIASERFWTLRNHQAVTDEIDQFRQVLAHGRRPTVQMHVLEEQLLAIQRHPMRHPDITDMPAGARRVAVVAPAPGRRPRRRVLLEAVAGQTVHIARLRPGLLRRQPPTTVRP